MNIFLKLSLVALVLLSESCDSAKSATTSDQADTKQTETVNEEKLMAEGYMVGTIKLTENSDCPCIIIDEKTGAKYDPINMNEKGFTEFQLNDSKVYYKCSFLRMKNRCNEAQPVQLTDIKKRED